LDAKLIAERTLTHSIINILNNAAQATKPEFGIEFHASWNSQTAIFKICDFGHGFPDSIIEFAGQQPVISQKYGLGVGLFLSYSTLQRLGGQIQLTNREEGGAQVTIILPLLQKEMSNER
jgi:two-component system sensor histidine kinase RegB